MASITIEPAYGRDYKSKAALTADFNAGRDFQGTNPGLGLMGTLFSIQDLDEGKGLESVTQLSARYSKLRKVVILKVDRDTSGSVSVH